MGDEVRLGVQSVCPGSLTRFQACCHFSLLNPPAEAQGCSTARPLRQALGSATPTQRQVPEDASCWPHGATYRFPRDTESLLRGARPSPPERAWPCPQALTHPCLPQASRAPLWLPSAGLPTGPLSPSDKAPPGFPEIGQEGLRLRRGGAPSRAPSAVLPPMPPARECHTVPKGRRTVPRTQSHSRGTEQESRASSPRDFRGLSAHRAVRSEHPAPCEQDPSRIPSNEIQRARRGGQQGLDSLVHVRQRPPLCCLLTTFQKRRRARGTMGAGARGLRAAPLTTLCRGGPEPQAVLGNGT